MINLTKFLLIGTLFAGAAGSALASPLIGTIDINGTAKPGGNGIINFTTNPTAATNGTGVLVHFDGSQEVVFTKSFSLAGIKPGAGELLFTMSIKGYTAQFFVTSYTVSGSTYTFTGYVTENGVNVSNATLVDTFNSPDGNLGTSYSAQLTLNPTPEPNSILLLGTGLAATCGMLAFRRRRLVPIAGAV